MKRAKSKDRELWMRIVSERPAAYWRRFKNFGTDDARTLRRAEMTLHRWAELECGTSFGHIERLEQLDGTTRPVFIPDWRGRGPGGISPHVIPDREAGALRRVAGICKSMGLHYYHQTDPRGCALYVGCEPLTDANYSQRGVPCCI